MVEYLRVFRHVGFFCSWRCKTFTITAGGEGVSRFPISDYQVKPLTPDRLVGRLRSLLNHPRLHFTMAEQNGRLECSIARRTGGRVYDLRVESVDGRVIVRGRSDSHHVKQLALAAVLEAFQASESQPGRVEMDIDVAALP
jgi:hypothetical protein